MDITLGVMVLQYAVNLREHLATRGMSFEDVNWDAPVVGNEDASHTIGVICGIAAGLDVTPLELLWNHGITTDVIETVEAPKALPAAPVTDKRRRRRAAAPTRKDRP